MSRIKIKKANL